MCETTGMHLQLPVNNLAISLATLSSNLLLPIYSVVEVFGN